jgi:hypothetical protein
MYLHLVFKRLVHFGYYSNPLWIHKCTQFNAKKDSHDDFMSLLDYWFKVVMTFYLQKVHYIHVLKYYINKFMFVILYKK